MAGGRMKMGKEGNGLLRLTFKIVEEADVDDSLRVLIIWEKRLFRPNWVSTRSKAGKQKSGGDKYAEIDTFRNSGASVHLPERPINHLIHDRYLTFSWMSLVPIGPRIPVTYHVEMCECPDSDWQKVKLYKW